MRKPHILVVEDEGVVALDIQNTLRRFHYEVLPPVDSGKKALQKASELSPDLILMDIRLNGSMDGIEAAQAIHSRLDIPVIYLTAHANENLLERAKVSMPFGYILKPFDRNELRSVIEVTLGRHRLEKIIKNHERWLADVLQSADEAVVVTDGHGRIDFMNRAAEELTLWKLDEARGRFWDSCFRFDDKSDDLTARFAKVLRGGPRIGLSAGAALVPRNRVVVPVEGSAVCLKDDQDLPGGMALVFRDVTELRNAEKRLKLANEYLEKMTEQRASELEHANARLTGERAERERVLAELDEARAQVTALTENVSDSLFLTDSEGTILHANPAAERRLGFSSRQLEGKNIQDLVAPVNRLFPGRVMERLIDRQALAVDGRVELQAVDANGCVFPGEVSVVPITRAGRRCYALTLRDATEHKREEAHLRFQADILSQTPTAVVAVNSDGRVIHWNPAAEKLFGRRLEEAIGLDVGEATNGAVRGEPGVDAAHCNGNGRLKVSSAPLKNQTDVVIGRIYVLTTSEEAEKIA
jgi:PAS domain S-box-containing protein